MTSTASMAAAAVARLGGDSRPRAAAPGWLAWFFTLAEAGATGAAAGNDAPRGSADDTSQPTTAPGYDAFVRAHERAILNYLWRVTGDEQTAYDLAQEVFLRAWQRFEQVRGYEDPRGWLFRVATNLALTSLARRRPLASAAALGGDRDPAASDPTWRLAEADQVRATLQMLNPQRRAALCLREVYGFSCAEVARALSISEPAARMTLSRAREQFRDLYLREERADSVTSDTSKDGEQHDA